MTETYEVHGARITIKPAGRGTWMYETFHKELCLFGQGGAFSKTEAKRLAEADALSMDTNKEAIKAKLANTRQKPTR